MASKKSLDALATMRRALDDMQKHLDPLILCLSSPDTSPHKRAVAQTAIALTLTTVRFMGARLHNKAAPSHLRSELNVMRKVLVSLQKQKTSKPGVKRKASAAKKKSNNNGAKVDPSKKTENVVLSVEETPLESSAPKRRKRI